MTENLDALCRLIKSRFPTISARTDKEFERIWGESANEEYRSYSWLEALANVLNQDMSRGLPASDHGDLFSLMSTSFESGDEYVRRSVDVAFVENLFWRVSPEHSINYWEVLPENLKGLYVDFHHRDPL